MEGPWIAAPVFALALIGGCATFPEDAEPENGAEAPAIAAIAPAEQFAFAGPAVFARPADLPARSVIVRLAARGAPGEVDGRALFYDPASLERQREHLDLLLRTQFPLLGKENDRAAWEVRYFDAIPFAVLDGDLAVVEFVERMAGESSPIVAVHENALLLPLLENSTRKIGAHLLHAEGVTGEGWIVVVVDAGVADMHPCLADDVVGGGCFVPARARGCTCEKRQKRRRCEIELGHAENGRPPTYAWGHGTHVAGVVTMSAAKSGDVMCREPAGRTGVAPRAAVLAVRVCFDGDRPGDVPEVYEADIAFALEDVFRLIEENPGLPIAAVNISLGFPFTRRQIEARRDSAVAQAVDRLREKGVPTVVAAGNSGDRKLLEYPAALEDTFSVGYVDGGDHLVSRSNCTTDLDLLAPGVNITSTLTYDVDGEILYRAYVGSGSSVAAPHVAAAFALLRQQFPDAKLQDLEDALRNEGPLVEVETNTQTYTRRRLDVKAAYDRLKRELGP